MSVWQAATVVYAVIALPFAFVAQRFLLKPADRVWQRQLLDEESNPAANHVVRPFQPNIAWYLQRVAPDVIVALVLVVAEVAASSTVVQGVAFAGLVLLGIDSLLQFIRWKRVWYVLTNLRAMRCEGWWNTDVEWIAWTKVTEVSVRQSWVDKAFDANTIEIHAANSASSFRSMRDIDNPEFIELITQRALLSKGRDAAA